MTARLVSQSDYIAVLQKLKEFAMDGYMLGDGARYIFTWDDRKTESDNLQVVMREAAALHYFEQVGVIIAEWFDDPNSYGAPLYENQNLRQSLNNQGLDDAYFRYGYVMIHEINPKLLVEEAGKYGLADTGLRLEMVNESIQTVRLPGTNFSITGDQIMYGDKKIVLDAQLNKIALLFLRNFHESNDTTVDDMKRELEKHYPGSSFGDSSIQAILSKLRNTFATATGRDDRARHFKNKSRKTYTFEP